MIINLFEKRLTPLIYKWTDSKSIVLKDSFDKLKSEKYDLEIKLDRERESKGKLQKEISDLEAKIQEMYKAYAEKQGGESLEPDTKDLNEDSENPENILFEKLRRMELLDNYLETVTLFSKENGWLPLNQENENIDYYLKLGLIEVTETSSDYRRYQLTNTGDKVISMIRLTLD